MWTLARKMWRSVPWRIDRLNKRKFRLMLRCTNTVALDYALNNAPMYHSEAGDLNLCTGLRELNVGLRQTYQLLEEVKRMLEHGRSGAANRW